MLMYRRFLWMRRVVLSLLACGLVWTAVGVGARDATLRTKDGRELTGALVLQNDQVVVLNIAGIETPIQRSQVAELELIPTAQEVYDQLRPTLEDNDLEARLALAQRVYDMKALELARRELSDLSRLFPGEDRIVRLDRVIEADQELARQRVDPALQPGTTASPPRPNAHSGNPPQRPEQGELITAEQVNLIRVYEIDLAAKPKGIRIDRETLQTFFETYRDKDNQPLDRRARAAFIRKPGYEQLDAFFTAQVRDLYSKVTIVNDPPALGMFRNQINPQYVARYFRQHFGQGQVPGLVLHASRPNAVEEAYTNFLSLHGFTGAGGIPMIDRVVPEDSLLLQWGLPREIAKSPAPQIDGWQPAFRSIDDPQYRQVADWIATLYSPAPNYGITAPGSAPGNPAPGSTPQSNDADPDGDASE